jgi:DNA (cytosine-5)-methyltransferase 1
MTKFKEWPDADVDVLVGGTPCQSFSVAGLRAGLDDPRGNLALVYLAIAERYRPRWLVWENVPGVLSSDDGRDFGAILGALGELGYGWAYRVLDAQYFGVAQRRRRVFVVGYLGGWRGAGAVLFERESLSGNPAPRRGTGERSAGTPGASLDRGGTSQCAKSGLLIAHSLRGEGFDASEDGTGRGTPLVPVAYRTSGNAGAWETGDRIDALVTGTDRTATVVALQEVGKRTGVSTTDQRAGIGIAEPGEPMFTLQAGAQHGVAADMAVRRLTPKECERLQGFPDGWTAITYRKKPAADGPRYKALGNSMAVPVLGWIGKRMQWVEGQARGRAGS